MEKSGIYQIRNTKNGKVYIGLSKNLKGRFVKHIQRLRNGSHRNKHLLSAFNKDGEDSFVFEILEECEENSLSEREKHWISEKKSCNNKYGYNRTFGGEFGKLHPDIYKRYSERLKGCTISEEQKKQISETLKGRKQPKEVVERRAKSNRKLCDKEEINIINLYSEGSTGRQIAELYGMNQNTIYGIIRRRKNDR